MRVNIPTYQRANNTSGGIYPQVNDYYYSTTNI